jgi:hypothetical protein
MQIHPNDGFIRQLKHYSEALKAQQRNARKEVSPSRSIEKSVSIDKQRDAANTNGYLDNTMPDFKSIELIPHRETTPQRIAIDRRGEIYERYASTQLKSPAYKRTASYTRDEPFQSLQQIPEPPPAHAQQPSFTPKATNKFDKYELVRTSTNYFTPSKPTLLNQKPYESTRKYDDYSRFDNKTPPAHTLTHTQDTLRTDLKDTRVKPTGPESFSGNRGEYFASKNSELDEKI